MSVLRTSWDLHRDMLSLTSMFFVLSFGTSDKSLSKTVFAFVMILCIISVLADRMIGMLLTTSLIAYAAIQKNRKYMILATVTSIIFITALLQGISEIESNVHILDGHNTARTTLLRNLVSNYQSEEDYTRHRRNNEDYQTS